jgi:hypothetical protein
MTKRLLLLAMLLAPISAWALTTANNRASASGDFLPGVGLSSQFGRMTAGEDYLPGGDGGGGGGGSGVGRSGMTLMNVGK